MPFYALTVENMDCPDVLCEKAAVYFLQHYNCAQSVLLTMFEYWGMKSDLIPKIAAAFGGGIGFCGSVCGAVTGGVMAIGVRFGTNEPSHEKRLKAYEMTQKFYRQFEKRHGTVLCRELVGYDLSTAEGMEKARNAKVFEEKCVNFVRTAVHILVGISEH